MRHFLLISAVATLLSIGSGTHAATVIDQDHFGGTNTTGNASRVDGSFGRAQTFTVGVAGTLAAISYQITGIGINSDRLDILSTLAGAPIGGTPVSPPVLGTVNGGVVAGNWLTFDVSALNIAVSVGDVLGFKVWAQHRAGSGDTYAGGSSYFFNTGFGINDWQLGDFDLNFKTFVDDGRNGVVPLPASGLLLIGAFGAAGLLRARKRR